MALTVVSKRYGMPAYKFGYYRVMAIVERDMGGGGYSVRETTSWLGGF